MPRPHRNAGFGLNTGGPWDNRPMHTTESLVTGHFAYVRPGHGGAGFSDFFPGFAGDEKLGVVSPRPLDGVLGAGYALLACVTDFYERRREGLAANPVYPDYFCFLGPEQPGPDGPADSSGVKREARVGQWGNLDIWPATQWVQTDGSANAFGQAALDRGVTHLFWPGTLSPGHLPDATRLAALRQLRSVLVYGSDTPNAEIQVDEEAEDMIRRSVLRMPGLTAEQQEAFRAGRENRKTGGVRPYFESYLVTSPESFFDRPSGSAMLRGDPHPA